MADKILDEFVIEVPEYNPTVGPKIGKFIDMRWEIAPKKNNAPRKDLILAVELDEKDEAGKNVKVEQTFNMMPRGRGVAEFKKNLGSWLGRELTAKELAGFKKEFVLGKPVAVNYQLNRFKAVSFAGYLPVKEEPVTA